MVENLGLIPL